MAPAEGLEPPTYWFEARYSIQLSYAGAMMGNGVPGRSRTCDLLDRNQTLYPLSYGDSQKPKNVATRFEQVQGVSISKIIPDEISRGFLADFCR